MVSATGYVGSTEGMVLKQGPEGPDIPAGYGSQKSGVRSQNRGRVCREHAADLFEQSRCFGMCLRSRDRW